VRAKQNAREGKLLLRQAAADLIPAAILRRQKRGFGSPVEQWLAGPLRPMAEDLLRDPKARIRGWLDGRAIDRVLDQVVEGRGNGHQGWALLALEVWARQRFSV
jgi:asparagine synthase (glutamine-hydrolysing)